MSRIVNFRTYWRAGQGKRNEQGSVALLLTKIPYLLSRGFIPPLSVLNHVLRSGAVNAGMSGAVDWKAFEVSAGEFEGVVKELTDGVSGKMYQFEETPAWVISRDEWTAWLSARLDGIPVEENLRLLRKMTELSEIVERAGSLQDDDERVRCLMNLNSVCLEWSELLNSNRGKSE